MCFTCATHPLHFYCHLFPTYPHSPHTLHFWLPHSTCIPPPAIPFSYLFLHMLLFFSGWLDALPDCGWRGRWRQEAGARQSGKGGSGDVSALFVFLFPPSNLVSLRFASLSLLSSLLILFRTRYLLCLFILEHFARTHFYRLILGVFAAFTAFMPHTTTLGALHVHTCTHFCARTGTHTVAPTHTCCCLLPAITHTQYTTRTHLPATCIMPYMFPTCSFPFVLPATPLAPLPV